MTTPELIERWIWEEVHDVHPIAKYILLALARYAKPDGSDIYPSMNTIAKDTGLSVRTIQRYMPQLEEKGIIKKDGYSRLFTFRWRLLTPMGGDSLTPDLGDSLTPVKEDDGDSALGDTPLGDTPLGDTPLGDNLTPELNKTNQNNSDSESPYFKLFSDCFDQPGKSNQAAWRKIVGPLQDADYERVDGRLIISGLGELAEEYQDRLAKTMENYLIGALSENVKVIFTP